MVSNLIFSYSERFFILPVPAFAFCDLGGVAGVLANELLVVGKLRVLVLFLLLCCQKYTSL